MLINLTKMSEKDSYALDFLLGTYFFKKNLFKPNKVYSFVMADPITNATISAKASLSHTIIKRDCNPNGKHKGQYRYEVIANETEDPYLGSGTYSDVYKSIGTFVPSTENQPAHYKIKEHALKFFKNMEDDSNEEFVPMTAIDVKKEYERTPDHMGMKPPIFLKGRWCIVMDKKGPTLQSIIKNLILPIDERISLCLALADALEHQVQDLNIVHRDIKPANIFASYDKINKKWNINIADYGLSKHIDEDDTKNYACTDLYASPEARKGLGKTTFKSDIYSIACVFSEILGRKRLKFGLEKLDREYRKNHISIHGLGKKIPGIDPIREELCELLKEMTRADEGLRPNIQDVSTKLRFFLFKPEESENQNPKSNKSLSKRNGSICNYCHIHR